MVSTYPFRDIYYSHRTYPYDEIETEHINMYRSNVIHFVTLSIFISIKYLFFFFMGYFINQYGKQIFSIKAIYHGLATLGILLIAYVLIFHNENRVVTTFTSITIIASLYYFMPHRTNRFILYNSTSCHTGTNESDIRHWRQPYHYILSKSNKMFICHWRKK